MVDRVRQLLRFARVADADARHAERTAAILRSLGADDELVEAGRLHDLAKPSDARLWHRVAATLLPRRARERLSRGSGTFARYLDHPRRGADLARARGASDRVVRLIARHHETPRAEDERMLHLADREALP
ncbi:MAG TPA: HD domain-containing protein [Candidatus Limnocylindria bacterium]|nr:HD domain-containing protein [Candidatus Limnocylindria bacterium]